MNYSGFASIYGGSVVVEDSTVTGNRAKEEGGAFYCNGGSLTLSSTAVEDNMAEYVAALCYSPCMAGVALTNVSSRSGGGVFCDACSADVEGAQFSGNTPDDVAGMC